MGQSGCWHSIESKMCFIKLQDIEVLISAFLGKGRGKKQIPKSIQGKGHNSDRSQQGEAE